MEHIDFVVWMLGYPLVIQVGQYLRARRVSMGAAPPATDTEKRLAGVAVQLLVWITVGILLY